MMFLNIFKLTSKVGISVMFIFFLTLVCTGCTPNTEKVSQDFIKFFYSEFNRETKVIITSVYIGEGDSDNVYIYVRFNVPVSDSTTININGKPQNVLKNSYFYEGKAELLYQKKYANWEMTYGNIIYFSMPTPR